ncbi:hypothetical protein Tco_0779453 [Tanacetum coccineum]
MWIAKCCQRKVSAVRILVNAAMSILLLPRAVNAARFEYNIKVAYLHSPILDYDKKGKNLLFTDDMICNLLSVMTWRSLKGKIVSFMEDKDMEDQDVCFVIIK